MLKWLAVALAVCLAVPAHAAPQALQCRLEPEGANSWVPELLFLGHDPDLDRVVISDPIILFFNDGSPVSGQITLSDDRVVYSWSYAVKDAAGRRTSRMLYRATVRRSDLAVRLSARPVGFDVVFTGQGTCEDLAIEP